MEKLQRKYLVEKFNSVHNSFTATQTDSHRAWLSFTTALHTQKYWLDFTQLKLEAQNQSLGCSENETKAPSIAWNLLFVYMLTH